LLTWSSVDLFFSLLGLKEKRSFGVGEKRRVQRRGGPLSDEMRAGVGVLLEVGEGSLLAAETF
jgi:hypothetical protein